MTAKKVHIAIDIDDVISATSEATRLWANQKAAVDLQPHHYYVDEDYWAYYNRIWATHNLDDRLKFEDFLDELVEDQAHVPLVAGAAFAITQLHDHYDITLITARSAVLEPATRAWIAEHFDFPIEVYFSANPLTGDGVKTKGELCRELGITILIDDNIDNCQSAIDYGVEAILFGDYGWNTREVKQATRCNDWPAVLEYLNERAQ